MLLGPYCGRLAQWSIFSLHNYLKVQYTGQVSNFASQYPITYPAVFIFEYQVLEKSITLFDDRVPVLYGHFDAILNMKTYKPTLVTTNHMVYSLIIRAYYLDIIDIMVESNELLKGNTQVAFYDGPSAVYDDLLIFKGFLKDLPQNITMTTTMFQALILLKG